MNTIHNELNQEFNIGSSIVSNINSSNKPTTLQNFCTTASMIAKMSLLGLSFLIFFSCTDTKSKYYDTVAGDNSIIPPKLPLLEMLVLTKKTLRITHSALVLVLLYARSRLAMSLMLSMSVTYYALRLKVLRILSQAKTLLVRGPKKA